MFVQTGPARWTDAAHVARLGLTPYAAPAAPGKGIKPAAVKAVAPVLVLRVPLPARVGKVAPSQPVALPPAPVFVRQARDMGRHELRAAGARAKLWLIAAKAASCVRSLTSDERHGVECTKARLDEMRQAAGLDSANW